MKKLITAASLVFAIALPAAPAAASQHAEPTTPVAHAMIVGTIEPVARPDWDVIRRILNAETCVTTRWRSEYEGRPITKAGSFCWLPKGRWVSKSWVKVAYAGKRTLVYHPRKNEL